MPLPRPVEQVSLHFSAKNLPKLHTFNVTDGFLVLFQHDKAKDTYQKLGTTEVVKNELNPTWITKIAVDYLFETTQNLVVKVFHQKDDLGTANEHFHELVGEVGFELSRVIRSSQTCNFSLLREGRAEGGDLEVRAEAEVNCRDELAVAFSGHKLANKDGFFGTSDPFITMSRMNEDGSWSTVWKSNKIDNSLNPKWAETTISVVTLCNADYDRPLLLEIFDEDSGGKHQSMGKIRTSLNGILRSNGAHMDVLEKDKKAGTITAANARVIKHPTFSQFINGGCEISLVVAIDYTGSNGDPNVPGTLHYINTSNRSVKNPYEDAIHEIGKVVEQYDNDKRFPVLGFGGRLKQDDGSFGAVSHCFNVASDGHETVGIEGVLRAYEASLANVTLSGPTMFSPLIGTTANIVAGQSCRQDQQRYTVLLILTDGVINDMLETKLAIIEASKLPMSVVIVGVGSAGFREMEALDSDKGLLKSGSHTAERDIVQFVQFNEAAERGGQVLAQKVLGEIPGQLLQYMARHGITPRGSH